MGTTVTEISDARATPVDQLWCEVAVRPGLHEPCPQIVRYRATFRIGSLPPVGSADLVVLPTWDDDTFLALDDETWELAAFGRLLRDSYHDILTDLRGPDPRADPHARPRTRSAAGAGVALVEQVSVAPPWQGWGLGLVGTGLALRELRRDAAFALIYPMQPGLATDAERAASREGLSRYWSRLGFTHHRHHHLVLDLDGGDLDAALARLIRRTRGVAGLSVSG